MEGHDNIEANSPPTQRHLRMTSHSSTQRHGQRWTNGNLSPRATTELGREDIARTPEVNDSTATQTKCSDNYPLLPMIWSCVGYFVLFLVGFIRELLIHIGIGKVSGKSNMEPQLPGFAKLLPRWESFYAQNMYRRVSDCFSRPLPGSPGVSMDVLERDSGDHRLTFKLTGKKKRVFNMGSWNYLGFTGNKEPFADFVSKITTTYGVVSAGSLQEIGYSAIHRRLENLTAEFLGTEDAMVVSVGFATNAWNMPCLVGKGCLIISDEKNHASMILGSRLSGATVRTFEHNYMQSLEDRLKEAVVDGEPRTHRRWKKVLIAVEGVYSMDASIVPLPAVVALKKKYKAYLYIDEAHSVGAVGPHGRGVVDHFGLSPKDVDILMGTFSKSFGSSGGYIAGSRELIKHLRVHSHSAVYCPAMPPPLAAQSLAALQVVMGTDGTNEGMTRIRQLKWNTCYFRRRLIEMGFIVYGNGDPPMVAIMTFVVAKGIMFSRECLKRGLGVVAVGYPATSLLTSRVRVCLSAAFTKTQLDASLAILDEVGDLTGVKYHRTKHRDFNVQDRYQTSCSDS